jgi:hypothetical protein
MANVDVAVFTVFTFASRKFIRAAKEEGHR